MPTIKLVVLDMAGTTVNEENLVYKTLQGAINREGFQVTLDEVLLHGAGKEKHQAIIDVLAGTKSLQDPGAVADKAFASFRVALDKAYDEAEISTFPGMEDFFQMLQQQQVAVVLNTGYDSKTANKLIEKLGWKTGVNFDALVTSDDVEKGRPHPDMILKAMALTGISDPLTVLKAGDSEIDILEGKNAGCGITVGVLSGAQTREQLQKASPDYILNVVTELTQLLWKTV